MGRREVGRQLVWQGKALLDDPKLDSQDTRAETASVLREMAYVLSQLDLDDVQARRLHEQSLALCQELSDEWGTAAGLQGLAWSALWVGDYEEAKLGYEQALASWRELGDQLGIAQSYQGLGIVAMRHAEFGEAEGLLRKALEGSRELGQEFTAQSVIRFLSESLLLRGEFAQARGLLQESVAAFEHLGFTSRKAHALTMLGFVEMSLGEYERARAHGEKGLELGRPDGEVVAFSLQLLSWAALVHAEQLFHAGVALHGSKIGDAQEAYLEARRRSQRSVKVGRELGDRRFFAMALAVLGIAARGLGDPHQARQHLGEALRVGAELGDLWTLTVALSGVALFLADAGEQERAVEVHMLASRYPFVGNLRWFDNVFGRHIEAVAATLSPGVAEAARERGRARGRARDLKETVKELLAELEAKGF